jgi:hypothetical protein
MDSDLFDEDHELFRASIRGFVDRHMVPNLQKWDADRLIDRETWRAAGKQGILGLAAPNESRCPSAPRWVAGRCARPADQCARSGAPWRCDGAGEAGTRRTSGGRRTSTPAGPPRHRIAYPNRAAGRRTRRVRPRQPEHRRAGVRVTQHRCLASAQRLSQTCSRLSGGPHRGLGGLDTVRV